MTGKSEVEMQKATDSRIKLYTHYSPQLSEIIRMTNVHSNNNYAEHLLKHLALQRDSVATIDRALNFVYNYWKGKGIDVSGLFLYDGSGLSPKNAICADFICDLLAYMKQKSSYATTFYASLPVAGRNGTVASFLRSTTLNGKASVKSGSFKNVQTYAGYINKDGKDYVFCIIVNNFVGDRKKTVRLIEQLLANGI
jgi:D-alanyl-D-alanine carboxypeptidase/D-alanyl-D-alanine-endopeptidase (penicillin-binding protein 4)